VIAIAGFAFGSDAAERQVVTTLDGQVGWDGARTIRAMLPNAHKPGEGLIASAIGVGFGVTAGVFALLFKYLPDAEVAWADVWVGALLTSALFSIGKFALGY